MAHKVSDSAMERSMTITQNIFIKKIMSFGCSFTMGGGINDNRYLQWLKIYNPEKLKNYTDEEFFANYYTDVSYPSRLAKFLNCDYENFGIGCASNELIINTLHQKTSAVTDGSGTLITIQPTFLHRKHVYDSINLQHILCNGLAAEEDYKFYSMLKKDIPIKEYNNMYLKYFYDHIYELNKYLYNLYAIIDSLVLKNFSVLVVPYENPNLFQYSFLKSKHICTEFTNVDSKIIYNSMHDLIIQSGDCMKDLPNISWDDGHANEHGHEMIAESLYNHLISHYNFRALAL